MFTSLCSQHRGQPRGSAPPRICCYLDDNSSASSVTNQNYPPTRSKYPGTKTIRQLLSLRSSAYTSYLRGELLVQQERWHEYLLLRAVRQEARMLKQGEGSPRISPKALLLCSFLFILHNYRPHYIEESREAGFSVITAPVFVYQANTMSANSLLMHAVPLTFREEVREDTSTHYPPWAKRSLPIFFFFFIKYT